MALVGKTIVVNDSGTHAYGSLYHTVNDALNFLRGKTLRNCQIVISENHHEISSIDLSDINTNNDPANLIITSSNPHNIDGKTWFHCERAEQLLNNRQDIAGAGGTAPAYDFQATFTHPDNFTLQVVDATTATNPNFNTVAFGFQDQTQVILSQGGNNGPATRRLLDGGPPNPNQLQFTAQFDDIGCAISNGDTVTRCPDNYIESDMAIRGVACTLSNMYISGTLNINNATVVMDNMVVHSSTGDALTIGNGSKVYSSDAKPHVTIIGGRGIIAARSILSLSYWTFIARHDTQAYANHFNGCEGLSRYMHFIVNENNYGLYIENCSSMVLNNLAMLINNRNGATGHPVRGVIVEDCSTVSLDDAIICGTDGGGNWCKPQISLYVTTSGMCRANDCVITDSQRTAQIASTSACLCTPTYTANCDNSYIVGAQSIGSVVSEFAAVGFLMTTHANLRPIHYVQGNEVITRLTHIAAGCATLATTLGNNEGGGVAIFTMHADWHGVFKNVQLFVNYSGEALMTGTPSFGIGTTQTAAGVPAGNDQNIFPVTAGPALNGVDVKNICVTNTGAYVSVPNSSTVYLNYGCANWTGAGGNFYAGCGEDSYIEVTWTRCGNI